MSESNYKLCHIRLNVKDIERTKNFYQKIFGATVICNWFERGMNACVLRVCPGLSIEVFEESDGTAENNPCFAHIAISSPDPRAAFADAVAKGAKPATYPTEIVIPSETPIPTIYSFIEGPDGEVIEICGPELC
jgi:catechol 2,3-dioxygenase-like lactoylglutathione lyase family enzyme